MNCFLFTLCIVAAPLASASYASAPSSGGGLPPTYQSSSSYQSASSSGGLEALVNQAAASGSYRAGSSNTQAIADIQTSQADIARISRVQAQLEALNSNAVYRNLKNSADIKESLTESNLASNIRQGNINIVAPNVVDQGVYRSLLVPNGQNNHQLIATQPLPPMVVNQPESPPYSVGGGPAAVVKGAPIIYKIKPSVIYQQEVINKVPTPVSLNPVYVKVYKAGRKVDAPLVPGVQQQGYDDSSYGGSSYSAPSLSYDTAPAPLFGAGPSASYGDVPVPSSSYGSAPASGY